MPAMRQALLVSSLANLRHAKGLAIPEIVANLCAPGRDISRLKNNVVGRFMTAAWYLHPTAEGRLYFKNVGILVARLKTTAVGYLREQAVMELKARLDAMFKPDTGGAIRRSTRFRPSTRSTSSRTG